MSVALPAKLTLAPCGNDAPAAGVVIDAVGAWFAAIATVTLAAAVAPSASVAVSVMTCVPAERLLVENVTPVPIRPLMLLDHTRDAPVSAPSSASVPVPAKLTLDPLV